MSHSACVHTCNTHARVTRLQHIHSLMTTEDRSSSGTQELGDALSNNDDNSRQTEGETREARDRKSNTEAGGTSFVRADRLKDLNDVSTSLKKHYTPKEKILGPFLPDIDTNLTPYVSTQVANYLIYQPTKIPANGVYRQRATAQKIPDPEKDLSMSRTTPSPKPLNFSYPPIPKRRGKIPVTVPKEFFKREKNRELLRLPKIPSLRASMPASSSSTNQLSHAEVLAFREALAKLQGAHASERARDDYRRAEVDCRKFRLDKLMPKSRPVFREALKSYMSTSKGAKEAATKVATKSLG